MIVEAPNQRSISPCHRKKRPAEFEVPPHHAKSLTRPFGSCGRRNKLSAHVGDVDTDCNQATLDVSVIPERIKQLNDPHSTSRSPSLLSALDTQSTKQHRRPGLIELQRYDSRYPGLLLRPDSRPISQEQLASEVKSIYAGLTMVETKCIQVDRALSASEQDSLGVAAAHWQSLIALHRTLLHEHHDFFLASRYPSTSSWLKQVNCSIRSHIKRHGIHSCLEFLHRHPPGSIGNILAFELAHQRVPILDEAILASEDTWMEILDDIGPYCMASQNEAARDRPKWAAMIRSWYTKTTYKRSTMPVVYGPKSLLEVNSPLPRSRIGNLNTLPHVHIMLSFLTSLVKSPHVPRLLVDTPQAELVAHPNTSVEGVIRFCARRPIFPFSLPLTSINHVSGVHRPVRSLSDPEIHIPMPNHWQTQTRFSIHNPGLDGHGRWRRMLDEKSRMRYEYLYDYCWRNPTCFEKTSNLKIPVSLFDSSMKWWKRVKEAVYHTIERLEQQINSAAEYQKRIVKLMSIPLKRHKRVIATYLCAAYLPTTSATNKTTSDPVSNESCPPIFKVESPFSYTLPILMLLYLAVVLFLRTMTTYHAQAFNLSFGAEILTGFLSYVVMLNCKEFPGAARATLLEIWFTAALHVGAQYCYNKRNPMPHIISFLLLLIGYGVMVFHFPSTPPLAMLPLYTTFISLIIWAAHEYGSLVARRQRENDEEQGQPLHNLTRTGDIHRAQNGAHNVSARRRNSNSLRGSLPNPSVFTIGDENDDTASLQSETTAVSRRN